MKYTRMLCWVKPHEKRKLKETIGNKIPVVFANNYNDFKNNISNGDYLLFSIVKASRGIKKCQCLVRSFPQHIFHLYFRDNGKIINNEIDMFLENNVASGQYTYLNVLNDIMISST
jgi:hypothetical protein